MRRNPSLTLARYGSLARTLGRFRNNRGSALPGSPLQRQQPEDPTGEVTWDESYFTLQCCGCGTVSFELETTSSEDWTFDSSGRQVCDPKSSYFPPRVEGRRELAHAHYIPGPVRQIYDETLIAIGSSQPVLAGIGLRAIVEAVCKEKAVDGRDLAKRINELAATRAITEDAAKILDKLRFMGNHPSRSSTRSRSRPHGRLDSCHPVALLLTNDLENKTPGVGGDHATTKKGPRQR